MSIALRVWVKRLRLKPLAAMAVGALGYALLAKHTAVPLLFGQTLRLQFALLGAVAVAFGPLVGLVAGAGGELLLAALGGSLWWSTVAASALVGFGTGFLCAGIRVSQRGFRFGDIFLYAFGTLVAQLVAYALVCPALDLLLYREATANLLWRGAVYALGNAASGAVGGSALLIVYGAVVYRPQ